MLSASSLLAGCGGGDGARHQVQPRIGKQAAAQLVALAQKVERDAPVDGCAAKSDISALTATAQSLVAGGLVPLRLRAKLLAGVQAVAADAPTCTPPAPPPTHQPHGPFGHFQHFDHHGPGPGHGHGHGHGPGDNGQGDGGN